MNEIIMYPCSKSGKILKGFCPIVVTHLSDVSRTLLGWIRFSDKFGIKYYFIGGQIKPLL